MSTLSGAIVGDGDAEPSVAVMMLASVCPTSRRSCVPLESEMLSVAMIMCLTAPKGGSGRLRIRKNRSNCGGKTTGGTQLLNLATIDWKRLW